MEISAKVIAHSVNAKTGKKIVTFELEYPRFIHSELMTHRLFSRNAASSRAIPVHAMIEMVENNPATPIHWGKNQPGMQASGELDGFYLGVVQEAWADAASDAAKHAWSMKEAGAHKQIANRILEPFQWMKTVLTATEFDNFFWLRKHPDAQPEIKALAEAMWVALEESVAIGLSDGQWHMPYYGDGYWYEALDDSLEDALAISSSCCAQVSYRKLDDSLEKARDIYKRLVDSEPVHASPFEHQAQVMMNEKLTMKMTKFSDTVTEPGIVFEKGSTHVDVQGYYWSGNFKGWIQHRHLIANNTCWNYSEENV